MTWLWILLAVVVVLLMLLTVTVFVGKASIRITFRQRLRVVLYLHGVPITLISDKAKQKKELKPCRNPRRALKRELRIARKAQKKAEKKRKQANLRSLQKQRSKQNGAVSPNLIENIGMVTALVKQAYALTRGKVEIRVRKMQISVATDDAATTAYLYAGVLEAMTFLCQWIESNFTHIERSEGAMQITAAFGAEKTSAEIDISFKVIFFHAISVGHGLWKAYRREKRKALQKAKARIAIRKETESV